MENNSAHDNSLNFRITPATVYISTTPDQASYANITVTISNSGPAIQVADVAITLPATLAPPLSLASVTTTVSPANLFNFGLSQVNNGEFDATPQSGSYVLMKNRDTWQFTLNMVPLISTITESSATVAASVILADGSSIPGSMNVNIDPAVASIISFNSQPATINPGQSVTLIWQCEQIDYCIVSPVDDTHRDKSGSLTVQPNSTTIYTLYAYGKGVILSAQWGITVGNPQILQFGGQGGASSVNCGDSITLVWDCNQFTDSLALTDNTNVSIPDLLTNGNTLHQGSVTVGPVLAPTIFTFTAFADDKTIFDQRTTIISINDPVVTFTASPDKGLWEQDAVTLQWNIMNASAVSLSPNVVGGPSLNNLSGSVIVNSDSDITYTLTVIGFNDNTPTILPITLSVQSIVIDFSLKSVWRESGDGGYYQYYLTWDVTAQVASINNGIGNISPGPGSYLVDDAQYTLTAGTLQHPTLHSASTGP